DLLHKWGGLFDGVYDSPEGQGEPPEFAGWNSSYTDLPLPDGEMREWLKNTLERIRSFAPKRVLEVGCGTGLILRSLLPCCEKYYASEISAKALQDLQRWADAQNVGDTLQMFQTRYIPAGEIAPGAVDTVIMNSVVQY